MKAQLGIVSAVLLALSGTAAAGTFSLTATPDAGDTVDVLLGSTTSVQFFYTGNGDTQDAQMDFTLSDFTGLTITPQVLVAGSVCAYNGTTLLRVVPPSGAGNPLTSTPTAYCAFSIAVDPAAPQTVRTISTSLLDCAPLGAGDTCEFIGTGINVIDTPPEAPAVAFAPNGGPINLAQGGGAVGDTSAASVIAVTTSGGAGTGSASYNCTVPAGFAATNSSNASIAVGSDPADLSVTCTLGATASSANMTCGVTDIAGSRDVSFTLNCPAGASAVYSSAPAAGAALATCNGAPGSTQTRSITITNTGTPADPDSAADDLALACSITSGGTNFAIVAGPTSPLEAGSSTTVDVQCTVPDTGSITGELDCNGNLYGLSATVQTVPPPVPTPAIVPATSEWSKLVLIALLAGLGALVVGFRRHG